MNDPDIDGNIGKSVDARRARGRENAKVKRGHTGRRLKMTYQTIHRFIPATEKHGIKTACGIKLVRGVGNYFADDGRMIEISDKGQPFDCKRCLAVLETSTGKKMKA